MSDSKRTDLAVRLGDRIRTLRETMVGHGIEHKTEKQPLFKGVTE